MFVRMQTCHCKNTCRRKSGRTRGCVCRDNWLPCSANYDCGPEGKPCSNEKEISSNAPAAVARLPSSFFDRHQAAAAKSREEIGVRNGAETMFMIAMNNNVSQPQISSQIICQQRINFSATGRKVAILQLCLIIASIVSSVCTQYLLCFLNSRNNIIKL